MKTLELLLKKKSIIKNEIAALIGKRKWHQEEDTYDIYLGTITKYQELSYNIFSEIFFFRAINWVGGRTTDEFYEEEEFIEWNKRGQIADLPELATEEEIKEHLEEVLKDVLWINGNTEGLEVQASTRKNILANIELFKELQEMTEQKGEAYSAYKFANWRREEYSKAYGYILGLCYCMDLKICEIKPIIENTLGAFNLNFPSDPVKIFKDSVEITNIYKLDE